VRVRVKMAEKASAKHCSSNEEYSSSQPLLVSGDKSQVELEVMQDKTGQSYINDRSCHSLRMPRYSNT